MRMNDNLSTNSPPFRVLSLDGGGIRGLYTANVLSFLEKRFRDERDPSPSQCLDIGKGFDLIVGTSTGGILATALASGVPISKIISLYRENGPKIFTNPIPDAEPSYKFYWWAIKHLNTAANTTTTIRRVLTDWFGTATIGSLYQQRKIALCLQAVKLHDQKPRVFKTAHIKGKNADDKYSLVDVCLATSAAPIYFPLCRLSRPNHPDDFEVFADGGLFANNPVLIALAEALQMAGPNQPVQILSIGTCAAPAGVPLGALELNQGLKHWRAGIKILELAMNSQAHSAQYTAGFLADYLSTCGREVSLFRIPESPPSLDQIKLLKMDLATDESLCALSNLGLADGEDYYKEVQKKTADGKFIASLFSSLPIFSEPGDSYAI